MLLRLFLDKVLVLGLKLEVAVDLLDVVAALRRPFPADGTTPVTLGRPARRTADIAAHARHYQYQTILTALMTTTKITP